MEIEIGGLGPFNEYTRWQRTSVITQPTTDEFGLSWEYVAYYEHEDGATASYTWVPVSGIFLRATETYTDVEGAVTVSSQTVRNVEYDSIESAQEWARINAMEDVSGSIGAIMLITPSPLFPSSDLYPSPDLYPSDGS